MRRIILGDTHGRQFWKLVSGIEKWDELIFIGDYFDTHEDISGLEQLHNFKEILEFKQKSEKPVILLIGNHDHHYFPEIGYTGTSGYQSGMAHNFSQLLAENRDLLQMAYSFDNVLCTHAGVGKTWLNHVYNLTTPGETMMEYSITNVLNIAKLVNEIWENKPKEFMFSGYYDSTGDDVTQTPIWIRPRSLHMDSKPLKEAGIIQIVGHTQVTKIDVEICEKVKVFTIDTLGTSGEYLIWEDGKFSTNSVK